MEALYAFEPSFEGAHSRPTSAPLLNLARSLLSVDPDRRCSADDAVAALVVHHGDQGRPRLPFLMHM